MDKESKDVRKRKKVFLMGKVDNNKQQKRNSLLDSAFSLFIHNGFNKTSISDIVNQQYNVIYHYDATISTKSSEMTSQIHSLKGVKEVYE